MPDDTSKEDTEDDTSQENTEDDTSQEEAEDDASQEDEEEDTSQEEAEDDASQEDEEEDNSQEDAEDDTSDEDVPEELRKSRESKDLNEQKAEDESKNKIKKGEAFLVAIGYISFLCILPLVLLRDSKYAQFHGKQALVLAIVIYFMDIFNVFHLFDFIDIFEIIAPILAMAYTLLKTIVIVVAIYMGFSGKYFKIPIIYALSEKFNINIK